MKAPHLNTAGWGAFYVTARDPPAAPRYKYGICTYAVDKLIRKRKAKGDTLEYFVRWLCAPRSSRLEALRPSMSGTRRQLAVRGARCECDLELCAVRVREPRRSVDRHGPAYRRVAPWRDRAQRGRTHAV